MKRQWCDWSTTSSRRERGRPRERPANATDPENAGRSRQKQRPRSALLALCSLGLFGVAPLAAQGSAAAQIGAVNARFMATFNRGDGAGVAQVYATDAMLMPPNGPAVTGRAGISGSWAGATKNGVRNLKLVTTELQTYGDMADEVGTWSLDIKPQSGAMMHDHGKFIVIWKRDPKAGWQLYRDIWNSDVTTAH